MRPTDILKDEHRIIEQVLGALDRMTEKASETGSLDSGEAMDFIEFFRGFADRCHHSKEEDHFFPAAEARGVPGEGGPIGVMMDEHRIGRSLIRSMEHNIEGASAGRSDSLNSFVESARSYVLLLSDHIDKEDNVLFPMADECLADEDQRVLIQQFEHVEAHDMQEGTHARYLEIANRLADRYGVPQAHLSDGHGEENHHG